ncbi:hypothetical protein CBF29_10995 [Vagococcus elongatus]|uniref:ABC3 transporter permease C-terminal domain-containing protein n=2 Tax=Vagococcus elongatus TaxID=180344 RepID=A0A430ANP5_9ENTE|nr:hypothetical protein CBF29_10995 [Vagococcus elongatus]
MLGVSFYVGIKATGPNMLDTVDKYYKKQSLMEASIVSTMGLTEDDVAILEKNKSIDKIQPGYDLDVNFEEDSRTIRVLSFDPSDKKALNQLVVTEGRLPKKSGEIVLDQSAQTLDDYQIGDQYKLVTDKETKDQFKVTSFEIVGFVYSPQYIEKTSRGRTNVGKGSIDYFAVISEDDFEMETYTTIYLTYRDLAKEIVYTDDYDDKIEDHLEQLEEDFSSRPQERLAEIKKEASEPIEEAKTKISDGEQELATGKAQLADEKDKLNAAQAQVDQAEQSGMTQLPEIAAQIEISKKEIEEGKTKLAEAETELAEEEEKLLDAKSELAEKEQELAELKLPEYLFSSRDDNPGYLEFSENADRISSIATVFPVFFFMIAALVCLTTMTRMVEEKRGEIGTLKALGYTNFEISQKFVVYATITTIIGTVSGLVIGFNLFPRIIFDAYGAMYDLPTVEITYYTSYAIQSFIVAIACTLLSTLVVLRIDLFSKPATLMRPKAPRAGKRIFLERMTFIWKRLNFNHKVTARNLFRYKQRMFMTVFGVAGCMALMVTGFGIRDSISDVVSIQYGKLWQYQAIVTKDEDEETEEQVYKEILAEEDAYDKKMAVAMKNFTMNGQDVLNQDVIFEVPEKAEEMDKFVLFNDRKSGETYKMVDDGVLVTEKLAKLFDLSVGDTFEMTDDEDQTYEFKVADIVENYAMHYVYGTPAYYEKMFGESPSYQTDLLIFNEKLTSKEEDVLSTKLMEVDNVLNVTFTSDASKSMSDMIGSLNIVVWVLIICAGLLAFIVLYNLTNINVSERIRELSTIKVLGFYPNEVTMYVYRENNILTWLGIIVGMVLGKLLHTFVLQTAEVDMVMFSPTIHWESFVYAGILTLLFSGIVMYVMHRKLKNIDMIEALKSNE